MCKSRKARTVSTLVPLLVAMIASARAAFEFPLEVAQPLVTEEGIFVSAVTYVKYYGSMHPGYLVPWVGRESCVIDELGKPVNRNVASLMGIQTGVDPLCPRDDLYCDTLRVFVDLSSLGDKKPPGGWSVQGAVEATIECVLIAAFESRSGWDPKTQERVNAKYVQLQIRDSTEFAHYGGVFAFDALGPLPRKRCYR